jgi:hypothetical protein
MRRFRCFVLGLCITMGCSFMLIPSAPKNYKPTRAIDCEVLPLWPVIDGVSAIGAVVVTALIPFVPVNEEGQFDPNGEKLRGPELALTLTNTVASAVGFGLSARHGFTNIKRCQDAKREFNEAREVR